jgi:hypothetical protein
MRQGHSWGAAVVKEVEIGQVVVAWLRGQGWDVYQEVSAGYGEPTADIVAVQGAATWVIETKRNFGLVVLAQAWWWSNYATFVSVATKPTRRTRAMSGFVAHLLRCSGIGSLVVGAYGVQREAGPRRNRPLLADQLRRMLVPQQMVVGEAGSCGGGYWTPYQETCRELFDVVKQDPGIRFREAMQRITHHYRTDATARSCLLRWVQANKVSGVRASIDEARHITLWPSEPAQ